MKERIGFIGLGAMGSGMAANIVAKGWPLTVWAHRNREAMTRLVAAGAAEAASRARWPNRADIVVLWAKAPPALRSGC